MAIDLGSLIISIMSLFMQSWNLLDTFQILGVFTLTDILLTFLVVDSTVDFVTGLMAE